MMTPMRRIMRLVVMLAVLCSIAAAAVTLASFAARWHWMLDLTTHWPAQLAVSALAPALVLLGARRWKWAMLPVAVVAVNAAWIAPLYWPHTPAPTQEPVLRAMAANVYTGNRDTTLLLDLVREEHPAILAVLEIDRRWAQVLRELEQDYPHHIQRPRQDNFGIALFSQHPILSQRVEHLADSDVPTIFATLDFHSQPVHVVVTHPLPPVSRVYAASRNRHMEALGERVAALEGPVVVLGDLNATSWSPVFADFVRATNLQDSRRGFGIQPTWPAGAWHLRIAIDHVLVSPGLVVTQRRVGPTIGSDHLPIIVDVAVKQE